MFDPVEKLKEFVRHASVSADSMFEDGMKGAHEFAGDLLRSIGFAVEVVKTDSHPIIFAQRGGPASWPHVIIYGHYDVQPADPLDLWKTPPFEPVERDGRLWGRGTADDKGPLMAHIAAVGSLLEKNPHLPLRITFVIEGDEETGSPSFLPFLHKYRDRLDGDFVLLSDTGNPGEDQVAITCGLRGLMIFDVEVTGARIDLHSGLHGGVLRNPLQAIAEVCATLHTPDGRVNVPGFYDDVVDVEPWEREELRKLGTSEEEYRRFLGIPAFHVPPGYTPFEAIRFLPSLEFNGMGGGYQGEGSKTVIPSRAFVKISCRLVPNQTPQRIRSLVYAAIRELMPADVTFRIIDQHDAVPYVVVPPDRSNTPKDQPPRLANAFRAIDAAAGSVFGRPPVYLRDGGSVGIIAGIKDILGLDSVMLGLTLPGDNLHAPNESFNLRNLRRGAEASGRMLSAIAGT